MATFHDWLEGARVRTLPASLSPVIVGAGVAVNLKEFSWVLTLLAAGVALFLQIGVNFSNDYSDGIRGTDEYRQGPPRLTGGGKAEPKIVLRAAIISYILATVCGVVLVWLSGHWWLLAVGAAALAAAWFYTGGKHPYGYAGLGELFVLIFFGYVATMGTIYTQTNSAPLAAWLLATGVGLTACALLMVNNIRDIPSDEEAGKKTLAVRLGEKKARWTYYFMLAIAVLLASAMTLWSIQVMFGILAMLVWVIYIARPVITGASGHDLLKTLRNTGLFELVYSIAIAAGLVLTTYFPDFYWSILAWVIVIAAWTIFLIIELVFMVKNLRKQPVQESPAQESSAQESTDTTDGDIKATDSDANADDDSTHTLEAEDLTPPSIDVDSSTDRIEVLEETTEEESL